MPRECISLHLGQAGCQIGEFSLVNISGVIFVVSWELSDPQSRSCGPFLYQNARIYCNSQDLWQLIINYICNFSFSHFLSDQNGSLQISLPSGEHDHGQGGRGQQLRPGPLHSRQGDSGGGFGGGLRGNCSPKGVNELTHHDCRFGKRPSPQGFFILGQVVELTTARADNPRCYGARRRHLPCGQWRSVRHLQDQAGGGEVQLQGAQVGSRWIRICLDKTSIWCWSSSLKI